MYSADKMTLASEHKKFSFIVVIFLQLWRIWSWAELEEPRCHCILFIEHLNIHASNAPWLSPGYFWLIYTASNTLTYTDTSVLLYITDTRIISANKDSLQVVYKPLYFNSFDHLIDKEYLPTHIQHWRQYQVIHIAEHLNIGVLIRAFLKWHLAVRTF